MSDAQIVALLVAAVLGSGGIGALVSAKWAGRKAQAEAESTAVATIRDVMTELKSELDRLHAKVAETQRKYERAAKAQADTTKLLETALADNAALLIRVEHLQRRLKIAHDILSAQGITFKDDE